MINIDNFDKLVEKAKKTKPTKQKAPDKIDRQKIYIDKVSNKINIYDLNDCYIEFYEENFKDAKIKFHKNLSNISKRYHTIKDFTDFMQMYADTIDDRFKNGDGFIILGNCGIGKSKAVKWIAKQIVLKNYTNYFKNIDQYYTVYYIKTDNLIKRMRDSYSKDEVATKLVKSIEQMDFLILDDLGTELSRSEDWLINIFLGLLKTRRDFVKPTLITTNNKIEDIKTKYNDNYGRLLSILNEFTVIEIYAKDYRSNNNKDDLFKQMKGELTNDK